MADAKISALTAATVIAGNEEFPMELSSANKKLTPELMASVMAHPGFVAARWYMVPCSRTGTGTAIGANTIKLYPWLVSQRITISDLGVRISTLSASGHIRLAIYASNASTKRPTGTGLGSVVVATDATGTISTTLGANISLTPGLYYFAAQADNATVACQSVDAQAVSPCGHAAMIGSALLADVSASATQNTSGYTFAATYASGLPDLTSATFNSSAEATTSLTIPVGFFKVTSVP